HHEFILVNVTASMLCHVLLFARDADERVKVIGGRNGRGCHVRFQIGETNNNRSTEKQVGIRKRWSKNNAAREKLGEPTRRDCAALLRLMAVCFSPGARDVIPFARTPGNAEF